MSTITTVHRSRWGYHPCTYELFLKLKRIHKWYWQTVYDFHRWYRWWRKQVHRQGLEPKYCSSFVVDSTWVKPVRVHGIDGYKLYPKTVVDHGIPALYHQARTPAADPVPAFDVETVTRIERLYEAVKPVFEGA